MNILVFGATGHTGRLFCEKISSHGMNVIAAVRNSRGRDCSDLAVSDVVDVDLESDLSDLNVHADIVVFAAGSGSKTGPEKTASVDLEGALKAIDWASRRSTKHFMMLSSLGCEQPEALPQSLETYLSAKAKADEYLRRSSLQHLIIKPARLTFETAAGTISADPHVDQFTPISRQDVADIMVRLILDGSISNRSIGLMGGLTPIDEALSKIVNTEVAA